MTHINEKQTTLSTEWTLDSRQERRRRREWKGRGFRTFLDDLESLLGELLPGQGLGDRRDGETLASVLVLVVAIFFPIASHGEAGDAESLRGLGLLECGLRGGLQARKRASKRSPWPTPQPH